MLAPHVEAGAIVAIGVVQEQHPDRARLYQQWRQLEWPIFVDALNELGHRAVPIPLGIDENGIVHSLRGPKRLDAFVRGETQPQETPRAALPGAHEGDELFHAGRLDAAIAAYWPAGDAVSLFRLGVALRRRYESAERRPADGQKAVAAWNKALALRPNQYIWRRRIQQYGPRLDKPYNFYGWIEQARNEIRARGEEPVPLTIEPRGAELIDKRGPVATVQLTDPDPNGRIDRDRGLVRIESIVTPAFVRPGHRVRVRLVFRCGDAFWNNEADPLSCHVKGAKGITVGEGLFGHPNAEKAETNETRILEFELEVATDAEPGAHPVKGYALYNACEKRGGVCLYLRQDFEVNVQVDPKAPRIQ